MLYYIPEHFRIEELVPPSLFHTFRDKHYILWQQFSPYALYTLDQLREKFGLATINDWLWGGSYTQSGFRTPESEYYSQTSQHTHARAFDLKWEDINYPAIRQYILVNPDKFPYLTCIEADTPTWLHFDCRNWDKKNKGILVV